MMNWFDKVCLRMAGHSAPTSPARRKFVQGAASTAALWGSQSALGRLAAQPGANQRLRLATPVNRLPMTLTGQCQRQRSGNVMTQGLIVSQSGVDLEQTLTYDAVARVVTTRIVAHRGGQTLVDSTVTTSEDHTGTATIAYGAGARGIANATLQMRPGQVTGVIDNRAVSAVMDNRGTATGVAFLDRNPAPALILDAGLQPIVTALASQASQGLRKCHNLPATASRLTTTVNRPAAVTGPGVAAGGQRSVMAYKPGQGGPNDPGDGWYVPGGTYNAPDCDNCWNNCGDLAADKSGINDWKVWIGGPVAWATAIAAYNVIWLACWGTCQLPGGGCCPVPCGGVFTCCGRHDNCFRGDLCCPQNMVVCNNVCCGANVSSCSPDGSCGCPTGLVNCGKECCTAGQICCGGVCAAPQDCKNGVYCPDPSHICNNKCCPPFNPCCNGQCCAGTCVNNVCCPDPKRVCGNTCCAPGQVCSNGSCFGCPTLLGRISQYACQSMGPNGHTIGTCCSLTSPTCCGGVCCGIGQSYCNRVNGSYVCTNVNPNPIH